jgi:hypothetical protein
LVFCRTIRVVAPWLLFFSAATLCGCAVPLGPGFQHTSRQIALTGTVTAGLANSPLEPIRVEVHDHLTNIGNRRLTFLDVQESSPRCGDGTLQRMSFATPVWEQKQVRDPTFAYELPLRKPGGCGVAAITSDGVYMLYPRAFPVWQPPPGVFSKGDAKANSETMKIALPAGYRVFAGGKTLRRTRQGSDVLYEFRVRPQDFRPFVVAGRYTEQHVPTRQRAVIFWTAAPIPPQAAQSAAEHLAQTAAIYENFFGPVAEDAWPVRVADTSADLTPPSSSAGAVPTDADAPDSWAASFPEGVLLDRRVTTQGIATERSLRFADYQLAMTWFGWHVQPSANVRVVSSGAMSRFALTVGAEARAGNAARRNEIARLIEAYDHDSEGEAAEANRSALLCVALEDLTGKEHFSAAIRHVLQALSGAEIEDLDLRAALESESGQDLADVFHAWLDHPGIPADFRARYGQAPQGSR